MVELPFKEDEDFKKHNQHAEETIAQDLRVFIADLEAIAAQVKDLNTERSDIFTIAKSRGFNVKAIRRILAERKRDAQDLEDEKQAAALYMDALL